MWPPAAAAQIYPSDSGVKKVWVGEQSSERISQIAVRAFWLQDAFFQNLRGHLVGDIRRLICCWHLSFCIRAGIEPATPGFLGPYSTRLNYRMPFPRRSFLHEGFEPPVSLSLKQVLYQNKLMHRRLLSASLQSTFLGRNQKKEESAKIAVCAFVVSSYLCFSGKSWKKSCEDEKICFLCP